MSDLPDNYRHKNLLRTASSFKDDFISLIKSIADLPHYHWGLNSKRCGKEYDNLKYEWIEMHIIFLYMCCLFILTLEMLGLGICFKQKKKIF